MGATPQPTVINTADPLKGKNSIPVIDRDPDPGSQILQRGALLETFFAAIHEQGKGFVQADYRVGDFIREHGSLLRDAGSVQGAITLRNNLLHPRARHINLSEKHRAAAALSNALQDLLPHLPSQLRAAAVRDPHEPVASEPLSEILANTEAATVERLRKLAMRLEALLASCDASARRPAYDLPPRAERAALSQRIKANSASFTQQDGPSLLSAARLVEELAEHEPEKVRAVEGRTRAGCRCMESAVEKLEVELGLAPIHPSATSDDPATRRVPAAEVGAGEDLQPRVAKRATIAPTLVEVACDPIPVSPTPNPVHSPGGMRICLTGSAARLLPWLAAVVLLLTVLLPIGCFVRRGTTGHSKATAVSVDLALISWSSPELTAEARSAGVQATAVLLITVNRAGVPVRIEVQNRIGYGLEARAIAAARSWKFTPSDTRYRVIEVPVEFGPELEP